MNHRPRNARCGNISTGARARCGKTARARQKRGSAPRLCPTFLRSLFFFFEVLPRVFHLRIGFVKKSMTRRIFRLDWAVPWLFADWIFSDFDFCESVLINSHSELIFQSR